MEYVEQEDEFDIHPIEELHKRRLDLEDEEVDVLTIDPAKPGQIVQDFRMPVLLDIEASDSEDEMIAIGAGQYRRKSQGADTELFDEDDEDTMDEQRGSANGTSNGNVSRSNSKRRRGE